MAQLLASKITRLILRYLLVFGAAVNIFAVLGGLSLYFFLDQPVSHAIDSVANKLKYERTGPEKKAGEILIGSGLAVDWNKLAGHLDKSRSLNPLLTAANPAQQFAYQHYEQSGTPRELKARAFLPPDTSRIIYVGSPQELTHAIKQALPGDVITLLPGHYAISGRSIAITRAATRQKPIYVRSTRLGDAVLNMDTLEGFHVLAPFWVFENLELRGVCKTDSRCEHAFHVVGKGASFTLRNSKLIDFNASIKVNGLAAEGVFPDNGLLEYNLLANTRARQTENPVTLVNINSVNNWVVRGNFIADFSKNGSDHISYGAFMKGGGSNGVFERNLIMCENQLMADRGIRIGLSFGGGGTGAEYCRNGDCSSEHSNGTMRNNIILNCSRDVGIYINKGSNSHIFNNLLHNTLGIDVRFTTSSAIIENNIISGRIKERDGGIAHSSNNLTDRNCVGSSRSYCSFDEIFAAPDSADLRLKEINETLWGKGHWTSLVASDFCGNPRSRPTDIGPIQYSEGVDCLQP
ncbi:MAG: hypothetical protein ACI8QT_001107 [Halioglobus sp.]|jgi:hypothetical protein